MVFYRHQAQLTGVFIDLTFLKFDLDIQKTGSTDHFMSYTAKPDEVCVRKLKNGEFKKALDALVENEDDYFENIIRKVVDLLHEAAYEGCTLYQLRSKLGESVSDEEVIRALHKLCSNDPGLVCRVGYEAVRYVHLSFISDWSITTDANLKSGIKDLLIKSRDELDSKKRKPIIIPSLWTDINGDVTEVVLKECKEAVVDVVVRRPGITEANIQRHLQTALSRREIRDILNILVEQKVLKQVQTTAISEPNKKNSIFGKTKTMRCFDSPRIEKITQTCFWPTPYTYIGLDQ